LASSLPSVQRIRTTDPLSMCPVTAIESPGQALLSASTADAPTGADAPGTDSAGAGNGDIVVGVGVIVSVGVGSGVQVGGTVHVGVVVGVVVLVGLPMVGVLVTVGVCAGSRSGPARLVGVTNFGVFVAVGVSVGAAVGVHSAARAVSVAVALSRDFAGRTPHQYQPHTARASTASHTHQIEARFCHKARQRPGVLALVPADIAARSLPSGSLIGL